MIQTDIIIIGAGPVGLFTVFEAGLLKLKCHLIDALPIPGGQCAEIYPKKPIYDIPGYPSIQAADLIKKLMEQIKPFNPGFTLGETAYSLEKDQEEQFIVTTSEGTSHRAPVIAIAGGLGVFTPRKPPIENLNEFEKKYIHYIVKEPEIFANKNIVISGGGDSALDWALYFAENFASSVHLIHRSENFRAHNDSVQKAMNFAKLGKIKIILNSEVQEIKEKKGALSLNVISKNKKTQSIACDNWLPLFGLSPKIGPIGNWGLEIEKNAIKVDNATDYSTNIEGIYAIGDVNTYNGKLKLILCGFHEAAIMVQSAFKKIYPNKNNVLKYTTVTGIKGF
ncbi:MAG: ferredoxin--NADP(+) reductase [Crocinitomicaceae bacterium]|nr:ferredoxin--NADP(+) reductase [Crocinitomicaceae bacterium]|tara:strand:+ start:5388 stop:6398 length:1011 start_codon:yes stop_codon:yes gene_type:complete